MQYSVAFCGGCRLGRVCYLPCRDGWFSRNTSLQPAGDQATWSSRNLYAPRWLSRFSPDPSRDERPSEHACDYDGSNGLYQKFWIISLANDIAGPRSGCKARFWETRKYLDGFALYLFIDWCIMSAFALLNSCMWSCTVVVVCFCVDDVPCIISWQF